ncbi:potassium-transporting ATPase subunit KdpA [Propioniciclava coleopterorum]|uniref:Potassium-transporting ATPase potassium-binding subunit n=1 Tax=Propioniciclava coleopterorum TaxID=2714937 RepID=A0A6G7Y8V9_9ACTN|nr:potassium-transporting ATPase subunit KdpA [Propioniciclava coleopterorum]QIK73245.1 potassium-transporting ATPase subunit KdpA [Propioniciclava coleopterorum]
MDWLFYLATLGTLIVVLGLIHVPLGDYMAWVFTSPRDTRAERVLYRFMGVDPRSGQSWRAYLRGVLLFSLLGMLLLYALQRLQPWLPFSLGLPPVPEGIAFNTAISFVTNTNWQSYSPESTLGYSVQLAGLAVQNFVSAATGIAVAVALIRGLAARGTGTLGNFWVDLTRATLRILLPIAVAGALLLVLGGVIQNVQPWQEVTTVAGGAQSLPGGPVASQEVIKLLGTNGGGFFNANSAHPFENPTPWTNLLEILLILVIPFSLPRTFGRMVGDTRQGVALLAAMATLALLTTTALTAFELAGRGTAPQLAGAALEGKEVRFGVVGSSVFASVTTLTSTGAVDSMHDSYTALGGMMTMLNMMLGEIAPGGVGTGLYGLLVIAIIAVFLAGLLVGRTPEYLGKKIGPLPMKLASLAILVMPALVMVGIALSFGVPALRADVEGALANPGPHGLSEVIYAFTSAANNNGSAFAGLTATHPWFTGALGVAMLWGRFLPIALVLALAGTLSTQSPTEPTPGTLRTTGPLFVVLVVGTAVLVAALVFFPILTLGPLAEGLA